MDASAVPLLKELNEEQRFAVTHTEGPMLVLAGAGSGKTRTLTYKIAYLIDQAGCRPERILAVTFTNKAAEEMRSRVDALLGTLSAAPVVSTFHSYAARTLRRYAERVGYRPDFTICDQEDQLSVYKSVYGELDLSNADELPIRKVQAVVSRAKSCGKGPAAYLRDSRDLQAPLIARIFEVYQKSLQRANAVDFDDLILLAVRLFAENTEVRERTADWFRYLLIDEYQDTNAPQYELIRHLSSVHHNVTAVGDEDQSIYRFRGADIGNILRFERDFPGASVVKLEQNYRSTQTILDAATAVVSHNLQRKGKVLWTREGPGAAIVLFSADSAHHEAQFVSQTIYELMRTDCDNVAILYRTNFQSRQFEEALRRLDIPYRLVGGHSFYSRKEIKDALAYLRLVRNVDDDVSLLRVINRPARGIGKVTLDRLRQLAQQNATSRWAAIRVGLDQRCFNSKIHHALERFAGLIEDCRGDLELPLHLALERILESSGYLACYRDQLTEEADNRLLNLRELITVAREYVDREDPSQEFLDNAALYSDTDDYDRSARVTLMTLHNAKGLEFEVVFLAGCEEGLFPHSRSFAEDDLEEERRLCYVGMTRARKRLYLTYSRTRRFYGRESEGLNLPSRFLEEVPPHLVQPYAPFSVPSPLAQKVVDLASVRRPSSYSGKTYNTKASVVEFLSRLPQRKGKSNRELSKGDLIEHSKFGRGRILQVEKVGDDLKLSVHFPKLGIKKLLQSHAKVKRV